jgi:hypothetical protein
MCPKLLEEGTLIKLDQIGTCHMLEFLAALRSINSGFPLLLALATCGGFRYVMNVTLAALSIVVQ